MTTAISGERLPSGRRSRTTRSRDDVTRHQRERMLAAMTSLVAENGYGAVSVTSVIARAGVSRATFYEQFADRQECFLASFDRAVDLLLAEIEGHASVDHAPAGEGRTGSFADLLAAYLDALARHEPLARVLLVDIAMLGPDGVLRRAASQQRISARLAEVVGARTVEDVFACDALVAAVGTLVTVRLAERDTEGIRALHEPIVEFAGRLFAAS